MKIMKIIWHFKEDQLTPEEKGAISYVIKGFHEKSCVVFSENLEITIIDEETQNQENNEIN